MAIVKQWLGICVNLAGGNNKWWKIELHDNSDVKSYWGKIIAGAYEQSQSQTWPGGGESKYESKIREKKNKSNPDERYTEARVIDGNLGNDNTRVAKTVQSGNLLDIAKKQIRSNHVDTYKLIEYLVNTNIHNILSSTTLSYNKVSGMFESPLGILDSSALAEGRDLLSKIGLLVQAKKYDDSSFPSLCNQFFRILPTDLGRISRQTPHDLFPDSTSVFAQNVILNDLEVSLQNTLATPVDDKAVKEQKLFDVTLNVLEDQNDIRRITQKYLSTLNSGHSCSHLKIKKIWQLEINSMRDAFTQDGSKIAPRMELWHGSSVSNILSILKSGFIVPPSNAPHVTGSLFGRGVYMAIQSTKSLNYSYGYWSNRGTRDNSCFMFLVDAGLGKYYVPKYMQSQIPAGYDSFWAKPGQSGIQNDEIIVPRTSMCNPTYLIQFE